MKLSIVILNYKTFGELDGALGALEQFPSKYETEVIVVDNDSKQPEEEKQFLHKWGPKINYILSTSNLGFGKGNKLGIDKSNGEYILIHNPDVRVWNGSLNAAIEYMDKNEDVGLLGGQL